MFPYLNFGVVIILLTFILSGCSDNPDKNVGNQMQFRNGDIIFHTSTSDQSKAIQLATNSRYSHCGII
jgi:hypothetical protein